MGVLTSTTCSLQCWSAKEDDCHCSCGGVNHGILNKKGQQPLMKQRKRFGVFFTLVAIGTEQQLYPQLKFWRTYPGWENIVDLGSHKYHYPYPNSGKGVVAFVDVPSDAQKRKWDILKGIGDDVLLLWVIETMPEGQLCEKGTCTTCKGFRKKRKEGKKKYGTHKEIGIPNVLST